jgi:hypothetical protein
MKMTKATLKKTLHFLQTKYHLLVVGFIFTALVTSPTFASASTPKLVSGTVDLFDDILSWLLLIIPGGMAIMLAYHAFTRSMADDPATIAEKNKLMKNVVIGGLLAFSASGLIKIILAYYQ